MIFHIVFLLALTPALAGCAGQAGVYGEYRVGFLSVEIDSAGGIQVNASTTFNLPTPLGVFEAGLYFDPAVELGVPNTLTIRLNGVDKIYNLNGEDFEEVSLAPGYYRKISITRFRNNIIMEVERIGDKAPETTFNSQPQGQRSASSQQSTCTGAPTTYIKVGDRVIVDLRNGGALRIMTADLCGASCALGQAYDRNQLDVLDGPRCWRMERRQHNVWYWYVYHRATGKRGWIVEGVPGDRYLCPLSDPRCGS